nr:hydroxyacid dehydrogenase [uncultured Desulfobacter sp.]
MKKTIVLIEPTIIDEGVEYLTARHHVVIAKDGRDDTLISCIRKNNASALIPRTEKITRKVIENCPSLKVIGQPGAGVDNIDVDACTENGIQVVHAPSGNAVSVAEHTMMFILALSRNLAVWDIRVRRHDWHLRDTFLPMEIRGKKLLIVGLGHSGWEVARFARAFDMHVMGFGRASSALMEARGVKKASTLYAGLTESDFVTLHVPLTPETYHMISCRELACMKKSAFLINVSRGPVVDPQALYEALGSRSIAGAALDVMDPEPPGPNHPLLGMDNIIFTPHLAGDTLEAKSRCVMTMVKEVDKVLRGMPPQYIKNQEVLSQQRP